MGINFVLNRKVLFASVTGSAGGPVYSNIIPLDYRFDGNQNRSIFFNMNGADTLTIQGSPDFQASANSTWYTVTSVNSITNGVFSLDANLPLACFRATLTGAGGAALVEGLL